MYKFRKSAVLDIAVLDIREQEIKALANAL